MTRDKTTQYTKLRAKFINAPVPRRYPNDKATSLGAMERELNIRPATLWVILQRQGVLVPCETQAPGAQVTKHQFPPHLSRLGEHDGARLRVWRDVFTKWIAHQIESQK